MAVDFKTFMKIVPFVTAAKKPVLIRGRHGVGKSEVVYALAKSLGMKVVERRASQMTEGDLIGLPSIVGDSTNFNPPNWYKECCDNPRVLFVDEIDRAITEVRQGFFELTDSRKLNGHSLHPDTLVFAAVNGGINGSQYQVGEMDPAELDRWTVFDVEPSVEDWLTWAKDNCDSIVWDFINQNKGHLEHKGEFEPAKVYPSRRSWARFNEAAKLGGLFDGDQKANLNITYELACAFLGFEAAVAYRDFVEKYERQVTVEDILAGKYEKTNGWGLNDHMAMCDKIIASGVLADTKTTKEQCKAIAGYALIVPAEVLNSFARKMFKNSSNDNTKEIYGIIKDRFTQTCLSEQTAEKKKK
jgi:midasin (ATPase involved in ribosome maturation)